MKRIEVFQTRRLCIGRMVGIGAAALSLAACGADAQPNAPEAPASSISARLPTAAALKALPHAGLKPPANFIRASDAEVKEHFARRAQARELTRAKALQPLPLDQLVSRLRGTSDPAQRRSIAAHCLEAVERLEKAERPAAVAKVNDAWAIATSLGTLGRQGAVEK